MQASLLEQLFTMRGTQLLSVVLHVLPGSAEPKTIAIANGQGRR